MNKHGNSACELILRTLFLLVPIMVKVTEGNTENDFWDNGALLMLMTVAVVQDIWYIITVFSAHS